MFYGRILKHSLIYNAVSLNIELSKMKILKLSLRNLNSLYGHHEIDFTATQFTNSGLFAITGETGSGKTTLLDAMTLALFGRVARECDATELMSHGTAESHAEIHFQVKQQAYRASWKIRRARQKANGKLQPVKRELAKLNGEILAEKVQEVGTQINQLLQLDFEQFTRSVLLAQGNFAKFLDSKKKERAEILEKITGTEIYRRLSEAAYERHKLEKQKLDDLSRQIDPDRLLSEQQKQTCKEQLIALNQQSHQLKSQEQKLAKQQEEQRNQARLQQQQQNLQQKKHELETAQTAFAPQQQRLQQHEKAARLVPDLQRLSEKRAEWLKLSQDIQATQHARLQVQSTQHSAQQKLHVAHAQLVQIKQQHAQKTPLINQVIALDQALNQQHEDLDNKRQQYSQKKQALQKTQNHLAAVETELTNTQQHAAKIQTWLYAHQQDSSLAIDLPWLQEHLQSYQVQQQQQLENAQQIEQTIQQHSQLQTQHTQLKAEQQEAKNQEQTTQRHIQTLLEHENTLLGDLSPEALEQALETAKQQLLEAEQLQKLALDWQQIEEKIQFEQTQLESVMQQASQQQQALEQEKSHLQHAEIVLDKQRVIVQQAQLLKSLEQHRAALHSGEACPLCGALEHPLANHYQDTTESEQTALEAQEKAVKQQKQHVEKLTTHYTQELKQQAALQQKVEQLQQQQAQLDTDFVQHREKSIKFAKDIRQTAQIIELVSHVMAQRDHLQNNYNAYKDFSKQRQEQQACLLKTQQRQQTLHSEQQTLAIKLEVFQDQQQQLQTEQKRLQQQLEQHQTQLTQRLSAYNENLPENPKLLLQDLQTRWQTWQQQEQQLNHLTHQLQDTEKQQATLDVELHQLKQTVHDAKAAILAQEQKHQETHAQRQALFGNDNPLHVQKQLKQAEEAAYLEQHTAQQAWDTLLQKDELLAEHALKQQNAYQQQLAIIFNVQQTLQQQARQQGFSDLAQARCNLLTEAQAQAWQTQQAELHTRQLQLEQSLHDNLKAIEQVQQQKYEQVQTEEELQQALTQLDEQRSHLKKSAWEIEKQLQDDLELRQAYAEQSQKVEQQKRILTSWMDLNDLIGSQKGDKFQIFAQSLTLQRLVQLANQHLLTLNPRYQVRQAQNFNDKPLELEIIDTYQADNTRSMNTLSGGERFLTSLALALGLSDLAAKNAEIHALFIDEGFGTLDSQTLDMAVDTLESLRASGKLIGVISHVEALQERLGTQVQVLRQGSGRSQIKLRA